MERSTDVLELLDEVLDDPVALDGNLRDLARVNRLLGGVALSAAGIEALAPHVTRLSLVDIGTGGADIPAALLERARRQGRALTITALDGRDEIVAAALRVNPELANTHGLILEAGDGRRLDFPDRSFDVAHCSLVLHHLEPEGAVGLLREMGRVARVGVVVNDLDRTRLNLAGALVLAKLATRNRYTRHDGPLSVRRAYRVPEVANLLRSAGLRPVRIFRGPFRHRYAIAAVVGKPPA
ncbi:MAG TPA: methyltransferase domain-containing protein [Candidatus Limnocylindrales bacterium]|jgi:ubiquinone/menaquinone biosynthesis C-methylase UbiE